MIYTKSELKNALFFEIAAKAKPFESLKANEVEIWKNYYHPRYAESKELIQIHGEPTVSDTYEKFAKFLPEFGVIVSVTLGVIGDDLEITVVSTESKGEKNVLKEVADFMNGQSSLTAAGYNLTAFSIPYLIKRMIVNQVQLPFHLKLKGKKPWEVNMIDVMKDYQGTVFESLKLETLSNTLGVDYTSYDEANPTASCEKYLTSVIKCAIAMSI